MRIERWKKIVKTNLNKKYILPLWSKTTCRASTWMQKTKKEKEHMLERGDDSFVA